MIFKGKQIFIKKRSKKIKNLFKKGVTKKGDWYKEVTDRNLWSCYFVFTVIKISDLSEGEPLENFTTVTITKK
ncbi:MAG: hypothetical protein CL663_01130 [Bacteroidetes bacterium]|nr:hypothetical protein [Bacteroidota bacterium]